MERIIHTLEQASGPILLVFCALFLLMGAVLLRQSRDLRRIRGRWKTLLDGTRGDNLERLLHEQLRERAVIDQELGAALERLESLERKMSSAKRYLGLVRYDAFGDMSGSQSFALALYDERGNGAVISNIVGRSECRVYCKPLLAGKCAIGLSEEEQEAIALAAGEKGKALIHS